MTIGFVPVKGDRPEWVVQKLTEAGVDRIAVLRSARAVVRWDGDRGARALDRLRRVAREAGGPEPAPWLPEVVGVPRSGRSGRACVAPAPLALAHPGGDPPSVAMPAMAVGPEGGWDDSELASGRFPWWAWAPASSGPRRPPWPAGLLLCALRNGLVRRPEARPGPPDGSRLVK